MEPRPHHDQDTFAFPAVGGKLAELRSLGGYTLLRRIGEGGMGSVHVGFKEGEDEVAIKVLNKELNQDPDFVNRFYREAQNGTRLVHPNLVRTYKVGLDQQTGLHFLVMEYLKGPSVKNLLQHHGYLSPADSAYITLAVARALEYAHSQHVIHRDIKPDNILMDLEYIPKLADLGLSKNLREDAPSLTQIHQSFGTTPYMPYEQVLNAREADERSDIYALGVTFYHLVTGTMPFFSPIDLEVIEKKKKGYYPPARSIMPEIPAVVDDILQLMLAQHPSDRFQSATELIQALLASRLVPDRPSFYLDATCLSAPNQPIDSMAPTRLNHELPELLGDAQPRSEEQIWYVRFHDANGKLIKRRATAHQILRIYRSGNLPSDFQVRKPGQRRFSPLLRCPEFNLLKENSANPVSNPPNPEILPPG